MNPCRCGMAGEPGHTCRRGDRCASDYQARISGPFLDRIDIRIEVPAISAADMITLNVSEDSETVARRVLKARRMQAERLKEIMASPEIPAKAKISNGFNNASASAALIEIIAAPDKAGEKLLRQAAETMKFSARAYHRILKVARTIADLDGAETVTRMHLAEAIAYRTVNERLAIAA